MDIIQAKDWNTDKRDETAIPLLADGQLLISQTEHKQHQSL
jgi:hypothetical protein